MSDDKKTTVKADYTGSAKTGTLGKPTGVIGYNKFLNAWQCYDAKGNMVLSTGSLEAAQKAYPDYVVKG